jgi:hypothetical protein
MTEIDLRIVHPGLGLRPKHFESLVGMRVGRAVRLGTPLTWELLTSVDDDIPSSSRDLPRSACA